MDFAKIIFIYIGFWVSDFPGSLKLKNPEKPGKTRNKFHNLLMDLVPDFVTQPVVE